MSKKSKLTPQEMAQEEIGSTEFSPTVRWFLLLAFLCTIFAVPTIQLFQEAKGGNPLSLKGLDSAFSFQHRSQDFEKLSLSESGIGYGVHLAQLINDSTSENARKFESGLEEGSWLLKSLGPSVEKILIGALKSGSRDVYCGRDGWLFFRPTIEYLSGPGFLEPEVMKGRTAAGLAGKEAVQPDPVRAIVDFRNQLARRGIELVVLPSPAKATIYPERFSSRYQQAKAPLQNPSYPEFLRRLQAQGVRVFDPSPLLFQAKGKGPLFLKTDTHWTPSGAELVARSLADYLQKNRLIPPQPQIGYPKVAMQVTNSGDLARMLKRSEEYGYAKERVQVPHITNPDGTPWGASRSAEILMLGDSYANIFSLEGMGWGQGGGLVPLLGHYLGRPVDAILINDKGSFSTRQQLGNELRRGEDRLAGKKVVVYEFASRELALGNWKLIDLTLGKKAGQPQELAAVGATGGPGAAKVAQQGLAVEGVIEEITQPPRPGSTAYKDAVIALHLKQVTSGGKPFRGSQIVVFSWGMRNDQVTAASRYRRGERVKFNLRPWSEVEAKYGSYQRIELQNDAAMLLDIFWLPQPGDGSAVSPPVTAPAQAVLRAPGIPAALPEKARTGGVTVQNQPAAAIAQQQAPPADLKLQFQQRLQEILKAPGEARTVAGLDGWLFSRQELNHLAKGIFWGEAAQTTSAASKPDSRDPLAAILDFKEQLDRAGIELIVVPVPAKADIYPDKLVQGVTAEQVLAGPRLDATQRQFLEILEKAGVKCVDLAGIFLEARRGGAPPPFLKTDTHWSPQGIALTAQALKSMIVSRPWYQALPKQKFVKQSGSVKVKGDLAEEGANPAESLPLTRIQQVVDGQEVSPAPDRTSPIILLGDSHTLIFHSGGDMHAKDGGLIENLAYDLGLNLDLVGVRGSGATPARVELARRRDNMAGKKLAIWCFTVREYTESQTGWRKVPVIR